MKPDGKVFLCISAKVTGTQINKGRDTGNGVTHGGVTHHSVACRGVTPATISWQMRVPNLFLVCFQGWTNLLPLSPSSPQQGTSIPRRENNGIFLYNPKHSISG